MATCACELSLFPCRVTCTCANPVLSGGCARCATYGNEKQRKLRAEAIAHKIPATSKKADQVDKDNIKAAVCSTCLEDLTFPKDEDGDYSECPICFRVYCDHILVQRGDGVCPNGCVV